MRSISWRLVLPSPRSIKNIWSWLHVFPRCPCLSETAITFKHVCLLAWISKTSKALQNVAFPKSRKNLSDLKCLFCFETPIQMMDDRQPGCKCSHLPLMPSSGKLNFVDEHRKTRIRHSYVDCSGTKVNGWRCYVSGTWVPSYQSKTLLRKPTWIKSNSIEHVTEW
jgi:hypothetical protein